MIERQIADQFSEALEILRKFNTTENIEKIAKAAMHMVSGIKNGGKIISCGNGGSMCDAMHFAEELTGRYRDDRPSIAAISISDPSHITCVGNDYGFDKIFVRQIEALAYPGDVAIGISTGGTSENILKALDLSNQTNCKTIGFSGRGGGKFNTICDVNLVVPADDTPRIQEMHIFIGHTICHLIEQAFTLKT